jgi:cysteine desulfurase / selenocysteine lyase
MCIEQFTIEKIREDFPILQESMHGRFLVYLDNANTTQKPKAVLHALNNYYSHSNANIHRSVYELSERATILYEGARDKIQQFINAPQRHELIFVKGATEGINLVAQSFGAAHVRAGDEIIISAMEHHSNIVPWQWVCEQHGASLKVIPINDAGELDLSAYAKLLNTKTRLVAITHISNVLGTINPVRKMIEMAHALNIPVLIDGAQATPHTPVDVQALDCDFYVFSGHKMYAPTGIGVLYGKTHWLESMPPYQGGGNMIEQVTFAKTTYNKLPYKFEAGTANIAAVVGFGAAIDYLNCLGIHNIALHENDLLHYATEKLLSISGIRLIGTAQEKSAVISFVMEGVHPHDIGTVLDQYGVAVRVGHHCAMPLMERYAVPATVRVSFGLYNTRAEVDVLIAALLATKRVFQA